MNFNSFSIKFPQKWKNGVSLRPGDIVRVIDADRTRMHEPIYSIYTWVKEMNHYYFLNQYEIFDYSTMTFENFIEVDEFAFRFYTMYDEDVSEFTKKFIPIDNIYTIITKAKGWEKLYNKLRNSYVDYMLELFEVKK